MTEIVPEAGSEKGGQPVYIVGKNFPKMKQGAKEFNCKFTPINLKMKPKIMPATYMNDTTLMCITPGGWGQGDKMKLQVTFNGYDYD